MIQCPIVGGMLGQRRRRCANIPPALGQCIVVAGYDHDNVIKLWSSSNTPTVEFRLGCCRGPVILYLYVLLVYNKSELEKV